MNSKYLSFFIITFVGGFIFSGKANSCVVSYPSKLTIGVNYSLTEQKILYSRADEKYKEFDLFGCDYYSGKYLLFQSGLVTYYDRNKVKKKIYKFKSEKFNCKYTNFSPEENNFYVESRSTNPIQDKLDLLNTCLKRKITDTSGGDLVYPESVDCRVEKVNNQTAIFTGICFFKVLRGSTYKVEQAPNEKCLDEKYLRKNNLRPMSLKSVLSVSMYPRDHIGNAFQPIDQYPDRNILIDLNPGKSPVKVEERYTPDEKRFFQPSQWILPDIRITEIKIKNSVMEMNSINLNLLTNTKNKNLCGSNGVCSSPSNFDTSFAPELAVYEFRRGRKRMINSTHIGARIQGQWEGNLMTTGYLKNLSLEEGKKYRIELRFSDPNYDWEMLKRTNKLKLGADINFNIPRNLRIGNDSLTTLGELTDLSTIPGLEGLTGLIENGIDGGIIGEAVSFLQEAKNDENFPPIYTKVCNKSLTHCRKSRLSDHLVLGATFKISKINRGRYTLDEIEYDGTSELIKPFKYKNEKKPKYRCR